jgi:hypothetical protein
MCESVCFLPEKLVDTCLDESQTRIDGMCPIGGHIRIYNRSFSVFGEQLMYAGHNTYWAVNVSLSMLIVKSSLSNRLLNERYRQQPRQLV